MAFLVQNETVNTSGLKRGAVSKEVVQAMLRLCPLLSLSDTLEDTDESYKAVLRVCNSNLAMRVAQGSYGEMMFYAGEYSGGDVKQISSAQTNIVFNSAGIVTVNVHQINDAAYVIYIRSPGETYVYPPITVGKLKSQTDGKERPFYCTSWLMGSDALVLTDTNDVQRLTGVRNTLSGTEDASNTGNSLLVMNPTYFGCAAQFLGLPTIGGGTVYYTNRAFTPRTVHQINGQQYYFVGENICVDVN